MDTRIDADRLRDRFRGCMVGLAVGDALGMPVETMTREEILAATGGKGVTDYLAPIQTKISEIRDFRPGQWTDDTQLALAIARSLVRKRGFDLADIAAEHVVEYRNGRCGWGRSTEIGIREIMEGTRRPGDPVVDPQALGLGNGVAMKIAPLALFTALRPGPITDDVLDAHRDYLWYTVDVDARIRELSELTHRDACARIGASCIAVAVRQMLAAGATLSCCSVEVQPSRFIPMVVIPSADDTCAVHGRVLYEAIQHIEAFHVGRMFDAAHPPRVTDDDRARVDRLPEPLRTELRTLYEKLQRPFTYARDEDAAAVQQALARNSCNVLESVPFSFATMMAHRGSFRDGVLATVNAGGDTDSNAAMVGAMLGAFHGLAAIPPDWVEGLETHDEIIALADQLFELARNRT